MKNNEFKIPDFEPQWMNNIRQGGEMNIEIMSKNLLDFKEIFDKYKIPFVLVFGTLLGAIREQNFIKWDNDADVACFDEDSRKDHWKMRWVKDEMEKKGFYIVDNSRFRCKTDFFIRNKERIDIFWFEKIDDEWINNNFIRYPSYYFDKLEDITFLESKFKVPHNPKKYLEYTYGKDWEISNKTKNALNLNPKEIRKRNEKI